jgi:hypothetical protein
MNMRGTISLFGNKPKPAPQAAPKAEVAKPKSQAFSFFGGGTKEVSPGAAPKDDIPLLSRWKQNADGSISGVVSNAKGKFKTGTTITTSPVKKGAKSGLVKTGSGSQYRLQ